VTAKLARGPLEYTALWKVAQRLSDRPVKFGAICAPALASMLWDEHYRDDKALINDLCDIMNAEFRELAAAGCPLIQVEEPPHHGRTTRPDCTDADLEFLTQAFNRQLTGVDTEIWVHTCWGNPNQQRVYWEPPSYERVLPYLLQLDGDVITFECASSDGRDLALFGKYRTDKKIGIGVVNHCNTVVEPPEHGERRRELLGQRRGSGAPDVGRISDACIRHVADHQLVRVGVVDHVGADLAGAIAEHLPLSDLDDRGALQIARRQIWIGVNGAASTRRKCSAVPLPVTIVAPCAANRARRRRDPCDGARARDTS